MKIITLTLNPAYDVHLEIPNFTLGREHFVKSNIRSIGGKGINITRALQKSGIETVPFLLFGEENSAEFINEIGKEGIVNPITISVSGRIRENFTIHPSFGDETRISFHGFFVDGRVLNIVFDKIGAVKGDIVTFTGSVPPGISNDDTEKFLLRLKSAGVRLVIDSKSVSIDLIKKIKPWLIKPNGEEIAAYFGKIDKAGIIEAVTSLHRAGVENAIVSLGGDGAILACDEGIFEAVPPKVGVLSTIGAGDSLIAGFIGSSGDASERIRIGVAYGTAACLMEGTNPPVLEDIERIAKEVRVRKLK